MAGRHSVNTFTAAGTWDIGFQRVFPEQKEGVSVTIVGCTNFSGKIWMSNDPANVQPFVDVTTWFTGGAQFTANGHYRLGSSVGLPFFPEFLRIVVDSVQASRGLAVEVGI